MTYRFTKDTRASLDGVRITSYAKGDIVEPSAPHARQVLLRLVEEGKAEFVTDEQPKKISKRHK